MSNVFYALLRLTSDNPEMSAVTILEDLRAAVLEDLQYQIDCGVEVVYVDQRPEGPT